MNDAEEYEMERRMWHKEVNGEVSNEREKYF